MTLEKLNLSSSEKRYLAYVVSQIILVLVCKIGLYRNSRAII